jgi:hypothetical protein
MSAESVRKTTAPKKPVNKNVEPTKELNSKEARLAAISAAALWAVDYGDQTAAMELVLAQAATMSAKQAAQLVVGRAAGGWAAQDDRMVACFAAARAAAANKDWAAASEKVEREPGWVSQYSQATRDMAAALSEGAGESDREWQSPARHAAIATVTHELVGKNGYTKEHYETLMFAWVSVFGRPKTQL